MLSSPSPAQEAVYVQDFEGTVGTEWSRNATRSVPITGKHLGPFGSVPVELDLNNLPVHHSVYTLSFDLFILGSWDGNGDVCCGPDIFTLQVSGGPLLTRTTFSGDQNNGTPNPNQQAYPHLYPGSVHPARTGASKTYTAAADGTPETISVYHMQYTFAHKGDRLRLLFLAQLNENFPNEGWGLDNVVIETAQAPELTNGMIDTLSGNGTAGNVDGPAAGNQLNTPYDVAVFRMAPPNVPYRNYVADTQNHRVRTYAIDGSLSPFAGGGTGTVNVPPGQINLAAPKGVMVDSLGHPYIVDSLHHRVLKLDSSGNLVAVAGTGTAGFSGDGAAATSAQLSAPTRIAFDPQGNLYIADTGNHRIRRVDRSGVITTVAGGGTDASLDSGPPTGLKLSSPNGVAVNTAGHLFISDTLNHRVLLVDLFRSMAQPYAGSGTAGFGGDGQPAAFGQLNSPQGLATDLAGNLFIADSGNHSIRVVTSDQTLGTLAGYGIASFFGDQGPGISAGLHTPRGLSVDAEGNLHIADSGNHRIRILHNVAAPGVSGVWPLSLTIPTTPKISAYGITPSQAAYLPEQTIGVSASISSPNPLKLVQAWVGNGAPVNLQLSGGSGQYAGSVKIPNLDLNVEKVTLFIVAENDKGEKDTVRHELAINQSPPVITDFLVQPFGPYSQGQEVEVAIKVSSAFALARGGVTAKIGPGTPITLQQVGGEWRGRVRVLTATDAATSAELLVTARNVRGQEATKTWSLPVDRTYRITSFSVDERGPYLPGQTINVHVTVTADSPLGDVRVNGHVGFGMPVRFTRRDNTFSDAVRIPGDITSDTAYLVVAVTDDKGKKGGITWPLPIDQTPPAITGFSVDVKGPYTPGQMLPVTLTVSNPRPIRSLTAQIGNGSKTSLRLAQGNGVGSGNIWKGTVPVPQLASTVSLVDLIVAAEDQLGRKGSFTHKDLPITHQPINFTDFVVNPPGPYTPGQRVGVVVKASGISPIVAMSARFGTGPAEPMRLRGGEWRAELTIPPLSQIGQRFNITIAATDDAGRTGTFVWSDTPVDAEPFKILEFQPAPTVIHTGGEKATVSLRIQSSKALTDVRINAGAGRWTPLRKAGDMWSADVLLPTVGPNTNQIPIQVYLRDEAGREHRESRNLGIRPGSYNPNGAPPALVSENVEDEPGTGRKILRLGWVYFTADRITKTGQSGDGNTFTYRLEGNAAANDFLRFDGNVETTLDKSKLEAEITLNTGRLYLDGIPKFGKVTLWQGQSLKFRIDGRGELFRLVPMGTGDLFRLAGLKLPIESAQLLLPNLNVPGAQLPGLKINGKLEFPIPQVPGLNVPAVQGLKVDVKELTLTRNPEKPVLFTGDIGLPDIHLGAFKVTNVKLKFVDGKNGAPDIFEGTGTLIAPNVFQVLGEVKFIGGSLDMVRAYVTGSGGIPIGPVIVTGGEIKVAGLRGVDPFTLFLGLDLTVGDAWLKNIVQLQHAGITYTYPTRLEGSSDLNILTQKAAEAALKIDLPRELGINGSVELLSSFPIFDVDFGVRGGIAPGGPYFEGHASGTVQIPNGQGFPYDALRTFLTLPYPIAAAGINVSNGQFYYYTSFNLLRTPVGNVDFSVNAKVALVNNGVEVTVGTNYGSLPTVRIGLLAQAPSVYWNAAYDPVMLESLGRDRQSLGDSPLEGNGIYIARNGGGFRPLQSSPPEQNGQPQDLAKVTVAANTPQVIFRVYGSAGAPRFTLTRPDGSKITPENAAESGALFTYNAEEKVSFYFVMNPPAGEWTVTAEDGSGGPYVVDAFGAKAPPVVYSVTAAQAATTAALAYNVTDPDSPASVSLFYDEDNQGFDGKLIARDLPKSETGAYTWNFGDGTVKAGEYYVYAVADDGFTLDRRYADTKITVTDPLAPGVPQGVALLAGNENSLTVTWSPPTGPQLVEGYEVRYAVDQGENTVLDRVADAASQTSLRLTKLAGNTTYRVAVVAYRMSQAEGAQRAHKSLPSASTTAKTGVASPPVVRLTSPTGGETLNNGRPIALTWTVEGGEDVAEQRVELSTDGGLTFTPLLRAEPSERSLQWQAPADLVSRVLQVRVTAFDSAGNEGAATSGDFSLGVAPPSIQEVLPKTLPLNKATVLAVQGAEFSPEALIRLNDRSLATLYRNGSLLTAEVPADMAAQEGTLKVSVVNPDGGTAESNIVVSVACGDADLNGEVEVSDAVLVLRSVVRVVTLTEKQARAANTDGNAQVDVSDAVKILRMVVKLDPSCELKSP
ncbi:MAG: fibronectin type III domain-containing protein [Armatimonadetes bacterium]|nr:fibronectin type III domain-containing protein [Armatimonadota bacterium]